ncbi:MAG: MaoC family dehydratase N-terminal domain-containing protein [Acidimicrobiales bacterium]
MSAPSTSPGTVIPPLVRRTGLANWNRYAAVNDEFIDIHMDGDAARAVGMPDVFGMGNLRIAYLHNLLRDWLGDYGDIVDFRCEFRGLNLNGDTLTCTGTVTDERTVDGLRLADIELGVVNQDAVNTTPASATVVLFDDGKAVMPTPPAATEPSGAATPGTFLTQATIDTIGRTLPPVAAPAVGANDVARWAIATYWPEAPPAVYLDPAAAADTPWGGIVAPRDFDPFAWMPNRPWSGDWLWGMGTEPGQRLLNGGQRNVYGEPIRPGDVISVTRRFVDVVERETKRGPMVFFTSEFRWTNQHDQLVRLGEQTTIYY